jgi:hypothetical protein
MQYQYPPSFQNQPQYSPNYYPQYQQQFHPQHINGSYPRGQYYEQAQF